MVKKGICKKSGLPCGKCMAGVLDDVTKCPNYQTEEEKGDVSDE